jgi:predicted dehydrogenase
MHSVPSRRRFLHQAAALGAGVWIAARGERVAGALDKLRVAAVGVGGRGWADLTGVAASPAVEVVALCDIDESKQHLGRAAETHPRARRYTDWRRLLDQPREFDALIVGTPDHMHAPISLPAMQLGKHVYCEKPLTHTVFEARQMRQAARKYRVATQMGNQIQSHEFYRTAVHLVRAGRIGKVREVHAWQSGPMRWLLAEDRPAGADPVPATLHWDHWLGVAPARPYKTRLYHPFNWRGWQDFSNGQLGDFGCHILDPVFQALELTAPLSVRAEAPPINREVWTKKATVVYQFPGTKQTTGPSLKLTWYDGEGHRPPAAALDLPADQKLPNAGSLLVGEKGRLLIPHVGMPRVISAEKTAGGEIDKVAGVDHHLAWVEACRGGSAAGSHFGYAGPLTEAVLLGTIAIRIPEKTLEWDAAELRVSGSAEANALVRKSYRKGWEPAWVS